MSCLSRQSGAAGMLLALLAFSGPAGDGVIDREALTEVQLARAAWCAAADDCLPAVDGARLRWVSRTGSGDLYLMLRADCRADEHCGAWFVERTAHGVAARLNVQGRFRVLHSGKAVPDVQAWRALSDNEFEVTRFSWSAGTFQRVESRTVFIVDGEECGSAQDCYSRARAAHQERRTGKALRIWEKVHSVSFI